MTTPMNEKLEAFNRGWDEGKADATKKTLFGQLGVAPGSNVGLVNFTDLQKYIADIESDVLDMAVISIVGAACTHNIPECDCPPCDTLKHCTGILARRIIAKESWVDMKLDVDEEMQELTAKMQRSNRWKKERGIE